VVSLVNYYDITAKGPQPQQPGEDRSGLAKLGFGVSAAGALGFVPTGNNKRVWDSYLKGIKAIETGFPGAILRTFRTSEFLSPLESWTSNTFPSKSFLTSGKYGELLRSTFGSSTEDLNILRSGSIFGEVSFGNKPIGMGMLVSPGTQKGSSIADYYARLSNVEMNIKGIGDSVKTDSLSDALLRSKWKLDNNGLSYTEWLDTIGQEASRERLILGAKYREKVRILGKDFGLNDSMKKVIARSEITSKYMRAKAATTAGRLNTLLTKPFEIPVLGDLLHKIPIVKSMAVNPGTASEMFARYTKKGLVAGAAYKGLEYYDYLKATDSPWATVVGSAGGAAIGGLLFNPPGKRFSAAGAAIGAAVGLYTAIAPRFDKGLFHGTASLFTDANVVRAEISQSTGLSESLRRQEEVTPGLVSFKTALGFGGAGALAFGIPSYAGFLGKGIYNSVKSGTPMSETFDALRKVSADKGPWESKIGKAIAGLPKIGKHLSKMKNPMLLGFAAGIAAWGAASTGLSLLSGNPLAAIPGVNLLGTTDDPEELKQIYSGEKDVAIRKGRWWEFGRSSRYEGGKIDYYRPHMLARLESRAYQKGMWGSEEEKWNHDPLLNPMKALFGDDDWKYAYEKKHQYDRPAPLTSTYGEDVPFFGPLIAATLGKLIKPRKMVRTDEWNLGNGEYLNLPDIRGEEEPAYDLGGLRPGAPLAPEEGTQLLNELSYRRREAVGLIGFAEGSITKAVTGREELFQNQETIATMGKETGSEYWLWKHLNLGGGLGATEPIRRFIPHTRSYLDKYNPLSNSMPTWIPDDYFLDLHHGNPFDKIPEAELRLPGAGYAALNPELEGVNPEEYPLIHRLKILGDVAMWSPEYRDTLSKAKANVRMLSDREKSILQTVESQVKERKIRKEFDEYRFDEKKLHSQEITVTDVLSPRSIKAAEFGDMNIELQGFGAITNAPKAMDFARENLLGKKITINMPSMEERRYDLTQSGGRLKAVAKLGDSDYGMELSNQGFAEAKNLTGEFEQLRFSGNERLAGNLSEGILHGLESPLEMLTPMSPVSKLIRKRSALEDYVLTQAIGTGNAFWDKPVENFIRPAKDTTEYNLGSKEIPEGIVQKRNIEEYFDMLEWTKAKKLQDKRSMNETMFGLHVFSTPQAVMRALPRSERDYYSDFSQADSQEERDEILSLVPNNEQRIYKAQWMREAEQGALAKKQAGIAQKIDDKTIADAALARKAEGFDISPELEDQWSQETNGEVPYDDWIRDKKAAEYFSSHSLPGADWLGWCIPLDQYLMSNNILLFANDIKSNCKLTTLQGENKVNQKFKRLTKEKMTTLKVHHNSVHSMSATNNHIVLAIKGQKCKYNLRCSSICSDRCVSWKCEFCETKYHKSYKAEWMPIAEVDIDTFMPIPLLKHTDKNPIFDLGIIDCLPNNTVILDNIIRPRSGRIKPLKRIVEMDESLAWLIGYYLAEGNVWAVGNRMRGVQFTAHIKEVPILELTQKIIKEKFGLDSVIRFKKTPNSESAYLVVSSSIFGWVINSWVGRYCDQKFAPIWLEKITLQSQLALLDGLNTGDSSKDKRNRLILANRNLCEMAKRIYEASGIPTSIHGPKKRNGKEQYSVEPLQSSLNTIIGENFISYRVKEIENFIYEGEVLDFEVEEEHMYCSPIGIYHNSPSVDMEDVKLKYVEMAGLDHHDFDLWGSRLRSLARKPYINQEIIAELQNPDQLTREDKVELNSKGLAKIYSNESNVQIQKISGNVEDTYDFEISDKREGLVKETYKQMGAR